MILSREITPFWMFLGERWASLSTPSMRYRTRRSRSVGSMWMSEARSEMAWLISRFTKRTTGASSETSVKLERSSVSSSWVRSEVRSCSSPSAR